MTPNKKNILYDNRTKSMCIMALFLVIITIFNVLVGVIINSNCSQLNSLATSSYDYSAIVNGEVGKDEYYIFDANIVFSTNNTLKKGINADIVMQVPTCDYTDALAWNTRKLKTNEIAISEVIAKNYGLKLLDELYSKHIVNGEVNKYLIVEILPDIINLRTLENNINSGIIMLGYDDKYINNLLYSKIVYSTSVINDLKDVSPMNILYRQDEIKTIILSILPYVIVLTVSLIVLSIVLILFLTKDVMCNLKRKIVLGFGVKTINYAYYKYIATKGIGVLFLSFILSVISMSFFVFNRIVIGIIAFVMIITIFSTIVTILILNKRLWGK